MKINVSPDSLALRIYQQPIVTEQLLCNYELNPDFREQLETTGLKVGGESEDGGAKIIELPDSSFFLATGFVPELNSEAAKPHPLIVAFLEATIKLSQS